MTVLSRGEIESAKLAFKIIRGPETRLEFCKKYVEDVFDTVDGLYVENADLMNEDGEAEEAITEDDLNEVAKIFREIKQMHKEGRLTEERLSTSIHEIEGLLGA